MLDESDSISKKSSFVASVNWFAAKPEFLEFPIILFANRPVDHLKTLNTIRGTIIKIVISKIFEFETFFNRSMADPNIITCHFVMSWHGSLI